MADGVFLAQSSGSTPELPLFRENIRLIVWDLDETFWLGTLTEGGIDYIQSHHDLVIWLAQNAVMSSICSKNDLSAVREVMTERGLWEYFIFPSIDWAPKAHRLQALIKAVGLRPSTVLFIDDNWQNLNQASALMPSLNVAEPSIIASLMQHSQLATKADPGLTRLKQYKANETKVVSEKSFSGDHLEFLRQSDIRVYFDYDVESQIDRVIELINRTNQLNFTKKRLPENIEEARAEILPFLRHNGTTPGLIRVVDRYGDYGYVGFYAMTDLARVHYLQHFCFSCRTINMYIEHFVYQYLGCPQLQIEGDVLSEVKDSSQPIDWIRPLPINLLSTSHVEDVLKLKHIYARGGCDLMALMHYFTMHSSNIVQEFNTLKNFQPLRLDHSAFLTASLVDLSDQQRTAALELGYDDLDFKTDFPIDKDVDLVLLSFWADADIPFYRHRITGLELPYWMIGTGMNDYISDDEAVEKFSNEVIKGRIVDHLRNAWDYVPGFSHKEKVDRYSNILSKIDPRTPVIMTLANERDHAYFFSPNPLSVDIHKRAYNIAILEASSKFSNVRLVDFGKYVTGPDDIIDMNHLKRYRYVEIYNEILRAISPDGISADCARFEFLERLARDDAGFWHIGAKETTEIPGCM